MSSQDNTEFYMGLLESEAAYAARILKKAAEDKKKKGRINKQKLKEHLGSLRRLLTTLTQIIPADDSLPEEDKKILTHYVKKGVDIINSSKCNERVVDCLISIIIFLAWLREAYRKEKGHESWGA